MNPREAAGAADDVSHLLEVAMRLLDDMPGAEGPAAVAAIERLHAVLAGAAELNRKPRAMLEAVIKSGVSPEKRET